MKRAALLTALSVSALLGNTPVLQAAEVDAQDVLILKQTVENQSERLERLERNGQRMALLESRLLEATREIENLKRANAVLSKEAVNQEQLKALAAKIEQVDANRRHDSERVFEAMKKIVDTPPVSAPAPAPTAWRRPPSERTPDADPPSARPGAKPPKGDKASDKGSDKTKPPVELPPESYEHIVKPNETVSDILVAYRKDYGLKTTMAQVEAANVGLNPKKLRVGQKLNIPIVK